MGYDPQCVYFSIYPEKRRKEKVYFFFDEIQLYPNWELFVERLRREENCEIYITGSSARMLSKEIGTALRGRTLSWELFPFSFSEYLNIAKVYSTPRSSSYINGMLDGIVKGLIEEGRIAKH